MKIVLKAKSLTCLLMMVVLLQCSSDKVAPAITIATVSPSNGSAGTLVAIAGTGFSATVADNIVKFNGTTATVKEASSTILAVEVPSGATTGEVTVQVGSKTGTGSVFTVVEPAYYIKFKADGVLKEFADSNPGFQACVNAACCKLPVLDNMRNADLQVHKQNSEWGVVGTDITGWNGQTIIFDNSTYPFSTFSYYDWGVEYDSENIADQTGSSVKITSVVYDGDFSNVGSYKVTGTFSCKVAKSGGSAVSITEGQFVVKYAEDY